MGDCPCMKLLPLRITSFFLPQRCESPPTFSLSFRRGITTMPTTRQLAQQAHQQQDRELPRRRSQRSMSAAIPPSDSGGSSVDDSVSSRSSRSSRASIAQQQRRMREAREARGENLDRPEVLAEMVEGTELDEAVVPDNLGSMTYKCNHCGAMHFLAERYSGSTRAEPSFGRCCRAGR